MAAPAGTLTPFVEAAGVRFRYASGFALRADAFTLARGEMIGLAGPNGAGKSTFLRLLAGLEEPLEGRVRLDGAPVDRRRIGFVFQRPVLYRGNVLENVAIGLRLRGRADAGERALEWLERLEIARLAREDARTISGGQVQRMALARALVTEPELLLLDEPFANLDAVARKRWREELTRLAAGRATLVVSHDATDLASLASRVEVMADGLLLPRDHAVARRWRGEEA